MTHFCKHQYHDNKQWLIKQKAHIKWAFWQQYLDCT